MYIRFELFKPYGVLTRNLSDLFGYTLPTIHRQEWPSETERCLEKIRQIKAEEIYGIAGKEESSEM